MTNLTLKKDPVLLGFAAILAIGAFVLVHQGIVTWKEAATFLLGALALPGLFGAKEKPVEEAKGPPLGESGLPKIGGDE